MIGTIVEEPETIQTTVKIPMGNSALSGSLNLPHNASGIVLLAQSNSNGNNSGNMFFSRELYNAGIGTLILDLLLPKEVTLDSLTGLLRFNIDLIAARLVIATKWIHSNELTQRLPIGLLSYSVAGGAALLAAARMNGMIKAVVSRCGSPDLTHNYLSDVKTPTLLIVNGFDEGVMQWNQTAFNRLQCDKDLYVLPSASYLYEQSNQLMEVTSLSINWFRQYL